MTNAFGTTDTEIRNLVLDLFVPPDEVVENGLGLPTTIPGYCSLFRQRVVNSIVQMTSVEGTVTYAIPKVGNIVGTVEGPELFAVGFNVALDEFLEKRAAEHCASTIQYTLPWCDKPIEGSLATYADDTFVELSHLGLRRKPYTFCRLMTPPSMRS